jgi:hypothetical protein
MKFYNTALEIRCFDPMFLERSLEKKTNSKLEVLNLKNLIAVASDHPHYLLMKRLVNLLRPDTKSLHMKHSDF